MKNYKYILGVSALSLTGIMFTSCSDDNKEKEDVQLPAKIEITATQSNLNWNEKETYINFSSTQKCTATSTDSWIEVETNKGEAGDYRLFITTEPNTYLLSRTGNVTISSGDKSETISIVQSGCTDRSSVYTINQTIEMGPTGWSYYLMEFSLYTDQIEGNLGMSLESFMEALQSLEMGMYMVDKNGNWDTSSPYTADPQPGYWLDYEGNVKTWDDGFGAYPGNAFYAIAFAETDYLGLEILRGDEVPQGSYDLSIVFSPTNDHSKYLHFNVEVVCPVYEPIIDITFPNDTTADINVEIVGEYNATVVSFDALEPIISNAFGISPSELGDLCDQAQAQDSLAVYFVESDGGFSDGYTANGFGFWLNDKNQICTWGSEGFSWYIENWANGINIGSLGIEGAQYGPITLIYQIGAKKMTVNISGYQH